MTTLHLIDAENLANGAGRPETADLVAAADAYRQRVAITPEDEIIVGSSPYVALGVAFAFPEAMRVTGHGPSGADHALLQAAARLLASNSFDEVVIGSGDHVFAHIARQLCERGTRVTVVARHGAVARVLKRACHAVQYLPSAPRSRRRRSRPTRGVTA